FFKDCIKQFFEVQNTESDHIEQIHYISGSLTGKKVDHCKPGFGKNINNNTLCPGCCGECPRRVWKIISNYLPQEKCGVVIPILQMEDILIISSMYGAATLQTPYSSAST
uniref:Uncharacterized protein n=1 Tax=Chelydra serpentina TaxID=8475 RepID=A0A8C3RSC0_CHESE